MENLESLQRFIGEHIADLPSEMMDFYPEIDSTGLVIAIWEADDPSAPHGCLVDWDGEIIPDGCTAIYQPESEV